MTDRDKLIKIIKEQALQVRSLSEEPFILASGGTSRVYLDLKKVILHSEGLQLIANKMWYRILALPGSLPTFDAIGGICVGADPIVGVLLHKAGYYDREMRGFLVRKEEKDHGQKGRIVGSVKPGDNCILVEDVVTTGGSLLDAIACLEEYGARVGMVLAVVDRLQGAREKFHAKGIAYQPLLTAADLGI